MRKNIFGWFLRTVLNRERALSGILSTNIIAFEAKRFVTKSVITAEWNSASHLFPIIWPTDQQCFLTYNALTAAAALLTLPPQSTTKRQQKAENCLHNCLKCQLVELVVVKDGIQSIVIPEPKSCQISTVLNNFSVSVAGRHRPYWPTFVLFSF